MEVRILKPVRKINKLQLILLALATLIVFDGCRSGKKRLEKGDYDTATFQAIKRLRSNPDSKRAIQILPVAYDYAKKEHLNRINILKNSADQFKFDGVVRHYEKLNRLYDEIQKCPSCLSLVPNASRYTTEVDESRMEASKAHFNQGLKDLEKNDLYKSRDAYRHFVRAREFTPRFDKIDQYIAEALEGGTIHVLLDDIPVHSRRLNLTNEFFQNQISGYVRGLNYTFVRFYRRAEAAQIDLEPDHIIVMRFDDFVVGQTFLKEKEQEVTRDSVVVGTVEIEGEEWPVYGTAKATLTTFSKSVSSSGLMDFQIVDAVTGQTVLQRKMPGTFVWEWDWATYKGQEEALTEEEIELSKRRELLPPPPQDLFIEFTKPIYSQIVSELRRYYSSHN